MVINNTFESRWYVANCTAKLKTPGEYNSAQNEKNENRKIEDRKQCYELHGKYFRDGDITYISNADFQINVHLCRSALVRLVF